MTSTAVATATPEHAPDRRGFLALFERNSAMIAPFLRPGSSLQALAVKVAHVAADNPELLECTPRSLVLAVAKVESWGLEIGETAHIVPFNVNVGTKEQPEWEKRAKALQDYKGKILMMIRAGIIRDADPHVVYEADDFDFEYGLAPRLVHRPESDPVKRGKMRGAYCIFYLPHSRTKFLYMPVADVDLIRRTKSKSWKQGDCPPWYAMKTVVHQMAKLMPKDERLAKVLARFDEDEIEDGEVGTVGQEIASVPAPAQLPAAPLPDRPAEARQGPYDEAPSLDGSHVATPRERVAPRSRTVTAAPGEVRAGLHPKLREDDPYDGAPVMSDDELDQLTIEQDARGGR
jgi:phage RecT family recombinase